MSPVPRHAGPTERRPSARKMLTLLLWLGRGWLWAAVPVIAQVQAPPSAVEATGPYRNLAENHNGILPPETGRERGVRDLPDRPLPGTVSGPGPTGGAC